MDVRECNRERPHTFSMFILAACGKRIAGLSTDFLASSDCKDSHPKSQPLLPITYLFGAA
jgi:hypothetical protein